MWTQYGLAVVYLGLRTLIGLASYLGWSALERRYPRLWFVILIGGVLSGAFFVTLSYHAPLWISLLPGVCSFVGAHFHRSSNGDTKGMVDAFVLLWCSSMTSYFLGGCILFSWCPLPRPVLSSGLAQMLMFLALGSPMLGALLWWAFQKQSRRAAFSSGEESPLARP